MNRSCPSSEENGEPPLYILGGQRTIPPDKGLFLEETWRLHPAVCAYTSELFYEGKLRPKDGLERQVIKGSGPIGGAGLYFLPVVHNGNQNSSPEVADAVGRLVRTILAATWVDREGQENPITLEDVISSRLTTRKSSRFSNTCQERGSARWTSSKARKRRPPSIRPQHRAMRRRHEAWSSSTASTGSTSRHPARQMRVDRPWLAQDVHQGNRMIDIGTRVAVFPALHTVLLRSELDRANHQTDVVGIVH